MIDRKYTFSCYIQIYQSGKGGIMMLLEKMSFCNRQRRNKGMNKYNYYNYYVVDVNRLLLTIKFCTASNII